MLEELLEQEGTIVDVRTDFEFRAGNVVGSINIPLHEVAERLDEFREMKKPLLLCCRSGNRSGHAAQFLNAQGIECHNAGAWTDLNFALANS